MDQAIDSLFNFDEGAKVREIPHAALHAIADLITLGQGAPRIVLHLFHAQANAARFWIDAQNFNFYGVAGPNQLAGMLHPFGPAHF